jgi:hypothetical protein
MPRSPLAFGAVLVVLAGSAGSSELAAQAYDPVGVQLVIPIATVEGGGWSPCFLSNYANAMGEWLPAILAGCDGDDLMLACTSSAASTNLAVLAQGPRSEVLSEVFGDDSDDSHLVNGAQWYYSLEGSGSGAESWGFADEGDEVERDNCDTTDDEVGLRLCWHLQSESGGYRCGSLEDLNSDENFVKRIYVHSIALFADDFEEEDTCSWTDETGADDDCDNQALNLNNGPSCGADLEDQGQFDLDPDPGKLGVQFYWNPIRRESGVRVQISHAATFGSEDDYVELGPGLEGTSVLHCDVADCTRTYRVMAHVGHAPGHGPSPIAGDLVSNACTLVPVAEE